MNMKYIGAVGPDTDGSTCGRHDYCHQAEVHYDNKTVWVFTCNQCARTEIFELSLFGGEVDRVHQENADEQWADVEAWRRERGIRLKFEADVAKALREADERRVD